VSLALATALAGAATGVVQDQCGPFTDVSAALCPYVLEMYYLGITAGTSPTTYSPDATLARGQAAVFVSKGVNQALARTSRRAALGQWGMPRDANTIPRFPLGPNPRGIVSDGTDVWVALSSNLQRFRGSDGRLLGTWTGLNSGTAVIAAMGRIFVTGNANPGILYMVDPAGPEGPATVVASDLGQQPLGLTFDGSRLWTANAGHSVSIITPAATLPWPSVTVLMDGPHYPLAALFDGRDVWVADNLGMLLRMNPDGSIAQTVAIGTSGVFALVFDGENIWVPMVADQSEVVVVRASTGQILRRLTGNGIDAPVAVAFDGERILVTNRLQATADSVSVWRAADLAPLGTVPLPTDPGQVCSDGSAFFFTLPSYYQLAKF
jgi:hypothetical protein